MSEDDAMELDPPPPAVDRKNKPSISWLWLDVHTTKDEDKAVLNVEVHMQCDDRFAKYFDVSRERKQYSCRTPRPYPYELEFTLDNEVDEKYMFKRLARLFRQCSRIKTFQIGMDSRPSSEERRVLLKVLHGVSADSLEFVGDITFHNDFGSFLTDVLSKNNVRELELTLPRVDSKSFSTFIFNAPNLVPTIRLILSSTVSDKSKDPSSFLPFWQRLESNINKSAIATATLQTLDCGTPSLRLTIKAA